MPDKYEREIEDILRNLKRNEPKARGYRPGIRSGKSMLPFNFSEWCLVIAVIAALASGGWAYANSGGNLVTGLIALIGMICVALVALSSFMVRHNSTSSPWR